MSEDTKQKIEIAIQELNYIPSYIARSLKRKRTNLIGIIIPNIRSPYFSTLIAPIEEHVTKLGYQLFISVIMENEEKEHRYLEKFVEMQVEGILLLHETDNPTVLSYIRKMKVPIVHVGIESPASNMPAVYVDNSKAICQTTNYLLSLGHKRILFLGTDPVRFKSGRERLKGYIQAMIAKNLSVPNELVLFTDYHIDSGYNAVKKTLARAIHFTAIVAVRSEEHTSEQAEGEFPATQLSLRVVSALAAGHRAGRRCAGDGVKFIWAVDRRRLLAEVFCHL